LLIVFDLDDTLIDTSGTILAQRLQKVARDLHPGSESQLLRLNHSAKSSKESLGEFCEISDLQDLDIQSLPFVEQPQTLQGANALLKTLSLEHDLILVTIGRDDFQREKIKRAGINLRFFSEVIVCNEKFNVYKRLLQKYPYAPSQVVVIGDRIDRDLTPAKLLGCKTIHIKWGRGVNFLDRRGHVDFAIRKLEQILDILPNIEIFS